MKEDSFKVSLSDFLAYLFPGVIMLLSLAAFLRLSRFKYLLYEIPQTLGTALVLVACAYFAGVAVSSLTVVFETILKRLIRPVRSLSSRVILKGCEGFSGDVEAAFNHTFGKHGEWSETHFYIARALVHEKMPNCAAIADRQNSLRQIRRNSVLPVLSLGAAGVIAGIQDKATNTGGSSLSGNTLIALSVISSVAVALSCLVGMYENRKREARNVCTSLVTYHFLNHKPGESPGTLSPPAQPRKALRASHIALSLLALALRRRRQ